MRTNKGYKIKVNLAERFFFWKYLIRVINTSAATHDLKQNTPFLWYLASRINKDYLKKDLAIEIACTLIVKE